MNRDLLEILVCPSCRGALTLQTTELGHGPVGSGAIQCIPCRREYPIKNGIPRFVPPENYAESFGFQWNRFPRTQLDSVSGHPITARRFFKSVGWSAEEMRDRWVLDVGCGSGRFAEVALGTGARVVAVDYSAAVEAARANLDSNPRIDVVQADIFTLPFKNCSFDFVYCLGVLQHTPDPERAFLALPQYAKHGGGVAVDLYPRLFTNLFWPKYWLRPLTKRMRRDRLFSLVERWAPRLLPLSRAVGRIPRLGRRLRYLVPVVDYQGTLPLSDSQLVEWSILDTFDMFSPAHDHPQSEATLWRWLKDAGLAKREVFRSGHLIARGMRP